MQAARSTPAVRAGSVRSKRPSGSGGAGVAVTRLCQVARSLFSGLRLKSTARRSNQGTITPSKKDGGVVPTAVAAAGMRTAELSAAKTARVRLYRCEERRPVYV